MAKRPIFISNSSDDRSLVSVKMVEFEWFAGLSLSQKKKSVRSLHQSAEKINLLSENILEISTKSSMAWAAELSAFHLLIELPGIKGKYPVENVYQSSKVFRSGGPFKDLLNVPPIEAKRDARLKTSGDLLHFKCNDVVWSLTPKTSFYDWLYISALLKNKSIADNLLKFEAFTDIEFNPDKSINCQAYAAALFVALTKRDLLSEALSSQAKFIEICYEKPDKLMQQKEFDW